MAVSIDWGGVDVRRAGVEKRLAGLTAIPLAAGERFSSDLMPFDQARCSDEVLTVVLAGAKAAEGEARSIAGVHGKTVLLSEIAEATARWANDSPSGSVLVFANLEGPTNSLRRKFQRLAAKWRADTEYLSSLTEIVSHPAYQRIIGLGLPVVPLILEELEKNPEHWFTALRAITGQDPVPMDCRGRVKEMRKAWLEWGRTHGVR